MRLILALALLPFPALADSVVATRTLKSGSVIAPQDVRVEPDLTGEVADIDAIIGQQLKVMVSEGRPIPASGLTAPEIVARNQIVRIAYDNAALRIEAEGRALSAGAVGQTIRVMNNTSRITISGRVEPDGTVTVAKY